MYIVYSAQHERHDPGGVTAEGVPLNSYELPGRAQVLLEAVQAARLGPVVAPTDHGLGPILAVHEADFVEFLRTAYAESAALLGQAGPVFTWTFATRYRGRRPRGFYGRKGYYSFGWGTPILEGTWEAAYWSAQCALTAADLLREGRRAVYALCRPPGHHAGVDLYGGYCYLNNAAIAARCLPGRVAILDVDYHHGNGTQEIFYADPEVLYASLHADPEREYPYYWGWVDERGEGAGEGTNHNWPLPLGTADAAYLEALDGALAAIRDFTPGCLVLSAGFDTVAGDSEGGFALTRAGLAEVGRRIAALGLPTLIVQEGGYLPERLGGDAVAFLRAFAPPEED